MRKQVGSIHHNTAQIAGAMKNPNDENVATIVAEEPVIDIVIAVNSAADIRAEIRNDAVADMLVGEPLEMLGQLDDERSRPVRIILSDPATDGP
jgi:hypothetical protein